MALSKDEVTPVRTIIRWCEHALALRGPGSIFLTVLVSAIFVAGTMIYVFGLLPARTLWRWWRRTSS